MKKIIKSRIFAFVLGAIIFGTVGVLAENYLASQITYGKNGKATVADALDDLYENNVNTSNILDAYWSFKYKGESQMFTVPATGKYRIELWGASGGAATGTYVGGKGGYVSGTVTLTKNQKLYIYVGGSGKSCSSANTTCDGGYNGGGSGKSYSLSESRAAGGGGATHISTKNKLLYELEDDKDTILFVAAGGGGGHYTNGSNCGIGGAAGGLNGLGATDFCSDNYLNDARMPQPATQETFGCAKNGNYCGSFGKGGISTSDCSGGGAGYYGGSSSSIGPGAGGSSYAISTATSVTHINGTSSMPNYSGESTMTGNSGNGYAKITYIGN